MELALDGDGRMLAVRARIVADLGAYLLPTTAIPPHTTAMLMCGCYTLPAAEVEVRGVQTNKVPTGPYRGAGRPEAAYFLERAVDDAARAAGIDPVELRRRNLITDFPHRTPLGFTYDSGDYPRCLERALELIGPERADGDERHARGTGVAMYVERAGGRFESAEAAACTRRPPAGAKQHLTPRPGARHDLRPDRGRPPARGPRRRGLRVRRFRVGARRGGHLRQPIGGDGRLGGGPGGRSSFGSRPSVRRPHCWGQTPSSVEWDRDGFRAAGGRAISLAELARAGPLRGERPLRVGPRVLLRRLRRDRRDRPGHRASCACSASRRWTMPARSSTRCWPRGRCWAAPRRGSGECLDRGGHLRRGGPAHRGLVRRLQPPDRGGDPAGRGRLRRVALAAQPARRQGDRRGRRHRHARRPWPTRWPTRSAGATSDPPFTEEKLWEAIAAVKPAPFEYAAPETVDEALGLLGEDAQGARGRPEPGADAQLPPRAARARGGHQRRVRARLPARRRRAAPDRRARPAR